jgi:hypothetical protein
MSDTSRSVFKQRYGNSVDSRVSGCHAIFDRHGTLLRFMADTVDLSLCLRDRAPFRSMESRDSENP